jgi:hypothetical protein
LQLLEPSHLVVYTCLEAAPIMGTGESAARGSPTLPSLRLKEMSDSSSRYDFMSSCRAPRSSSPSLPRRSSPNLRCLVLQVTSRVLYIETETSRPCSECTHSVGSCWRETRVKKSGPCVSKKGLVRVSVWRQASGMRLDVTIRLPLLSSYS